MNWHQILSIIVAIIAVLWFWRGTLLATKSYGVVNYQELMVVLAMISNKLIGCLYIIGSLITLTILLI